MHSTLTIHPIPVQNLQLPKLWYENNPVKTHFFNALSTLFPQGENYFIWSVKNFASAAQSEELRQQIQDFVTQEKNHAAIHKAYNRCLARAGYDIPRMEQALHKKISFGQENVKPIINLAITVATEHLTAVLGEKVLQGHLVPEGTDPAMRKLWIWHALEEIDHKSVAMDVFVDAGGSYLLRCRAMTYAFTTFWFDAITRMLHMLRKDGLLWKLRTFWQIADLLLGRKGILRLIMPDILKYFAPRFHPSRHDNYGLVFHGRELLQADAAVGSF